MTSSARPGAGIRRWFNSLNWGFFLDRIYRIYKILNFQFPEETENTQSPSANKNGSHNNLKKAKAAQWS
jgi:hypothetical protein